MRDKTNRPTVALLGPSLGAVSGVSTHLQQMFSSALAVAFDLEHFQIGAEGRREGRAMALWRYATSPATLLYYLLKASPKIVHLNTSLEPKAFWRDTVYMVVAKLLRRKVVLQVHGGALPQNFLGTSWAAHALLRVILKMPDALVVLAEVEKVAYGRFLPGQSIFSIPNAIDLAEYRGFAPKRYDRDVVRAVYIGRLAADKGVWEVVQAMRILRSHGCDAITLDIAGSGPYEAEIRAAIVDAGLDGTIRMLGPVFGEAKHRLWEEADLFVFPTFHREGLPYAVLESLASGTPMITTDVGGIVDVIRDGVQGKIVPPRDADRLAIVLQDVIRDREWLRAASRQCIARARAEYGVDRLARQFAELYKGVLR